MSHLHVHEPYFLRSTQTQVHVYIYSTAQHKLFCTLRLDEPFPSSHMLTRIRTLQLHTHKPTSSHLVRPSACPHNTRSKYNRYTKTNKQTRRKKTEDRMIYHPSLHLTQHHYHYLARFKLIRIQQLCISRKKVYIYKKAKGKKETRDPNERDAGVIK